MKRRGKERKWRKDKILGEGDPIELENRRWGSNREGKPGVGPGSALVPGVHLEDNFWSVSSNILFVPVLPLPPWWLL